MRATFLGAGIDAVEALPRVGVAGAILWGSLRAGAGRSRGRSARGRGAGRFNAPAAGRQRVTQ
eukprot:6776961-Lingulodinium_polyedra.AAC.1